MAVGCSELCDALDEVPPWGEFGCDLICAYVGIESFLTLMAIENPTPILICQNWHMCSYQTGGRVSITNATVYPTSATAGTVFRLSVNYQVLTNTSVGTVNYELISPGGQRTIGSKFCGCENCEK